MNEARVKTSSLIPQTAQTNLSLFTSLLANNDEDDDLVEKKQNIDTNNRESLINEPIQRDNLFPSLFSAPAATAAEYPSMYYLPNFQSGGDTINSEQCTTDGQNGAAAQFPVMNSQQGFVRVGNDLTPIFPGLNSSWVPQPVGNPYQYCCFPYNAMCAVAPNLKHKTDDTWISHDPQQMESQFGHIPGSFNHESVFHANFLPIQAMLQNPYLPKPVTDPTSSCSLSSLISKSQELGACATSRGSRDDYPFVPKPVRGPVLNYTDSPPFTNKEEANICTTSQGPRDDNSINDTSPMTIHKRKLDGTSYMSNTSNISPIDGKNNENVEPSARHVIPRWMETNAAEAIQSMRSALVSTSAKPQSRYPTAANSYGLEEEKEIEGKGWALLVQKELRNTDVGNLGRIVLPKKDAEANFPQLVAKDGVILQMEDMTFSIIWKFKYRYWPNNKSRMYVMENTGDFVRTHNLQTGDFFIVYKEKSSGKYIARGKKGVKYVGDCGKPEAGETEGKKQFLKRKALASANGEVNVKAENGAFATWERFSLEENSGSSQLIKPL
ncbi:B3 domain-containing transcription factor abi3 [Thalictrum thalictroides]|uniref:B3 domain-containing transcription factor abi3 n=1 Tax=Thalictrum thalictroides TaxID=46969 RepID=A0A7J6WHN5_THATH|nr:B3 domain-containing transcription factor abi3 [Thalictrum thalictroides]